MGNYIDKIKIGTRGSKLALWQANWVKSKLTENYSNLSVELVVIKTQGDKILDVPLANIGGKGLFVKEIETALLEKSIDLAVHSMKDVPIIIPEGLSISCVTEREDPFDVLISKNGYGLKDIKQEAKIGTSSLRRQSQLLHFRPDLEMVTLRGNLQTRLKKLEEQNMDAIVLAYAGVKRMGLDYLVTEKIHPEICLPAVGQGVLAIETRTEDRSINKTIEFLNDPESALTMSAERAFLTRLEGGCQVPIAAYAQLNEKGLEIEGMIASLDGKKVIRQRKAGSYEEAEVLGIELAETLLSFGGERILKEIYE